MRDSDSKIVADGMERLHKAKSYSVIRKRLLAEVALRHEAERKIASFWRRLWIRVKIHREVSTELKREFPPAALHIGAAK